jgi:gamma-glutamylcyclotransferase (GGCT)/AIG2-like uncharacterized protein YtfP
VAYLKYFAFGSNMDLEQMAHRCPQARVVSPGILKGYQFRINSRGVATMIPLPGARTYGLIWEITPQDCRHLDRYEGVASGYYYREEVAISTPAGERHSCLTYIAAEETPGAPRQGYLERIIHWAERHGLPRDYIDRELRPWLAE